MIRPYALSLTALCLTALTACGPSAPRHYYTLTYPALAPITAEAAPVTVRLKPFKVRETYRSNELVFRPDIHEIRFYKTRRWSERPQKMLTALIRDHLRTSGTVERVVDAIGQTPPDYTLTGEVEAIEQLEAGPKRYARIAMSYRLIRFSDDQVVWSWRFDEQRPTSTSVLGTVRGLSGLLAEQNQRAFARMHAHLTGAPNPEVTQQAEAQAAAAAAPGVIQPAPFSAHPQLQADNTAMPLNQGALFLPTLSSGLREPTVLVLSENDDATVAEARSGERIILPPGTYRVRFGSGAPSQQLTQKVRVEAGRTTIVPADDWAALDIRLLDQQFVPFRGTYEIISVDTREDFGVGFGADALLGEQTRVWVLRPGLYKIIRAGGTYRDRIDFVTVRLVPGQLTRYTLVQDRTNGDFRGGGELWSNLVGEDPTEDDDWTISAVLGANFNFIQSNLITQQEGFSYGYDVFFDGTAIFNDQTHLWSNRLDVALGQFSPVANEDEDRQFRTQSDRLFANSIYVYQLTPWFGPYGRMGITTNMLERRQWFDDGVRVVDDEGAVDVARSVSLGQPFAPMTLLQGAGGNFRVLRTRPVELDIRAGVGARQLLANGLRIIDSRSGTFEDPDRVRGVDGNSSFGFEGTVVGLVRIWRLIGTTEFDGLLPVTNDAGLFTWRNQLSLRLASFISLNYRFNMNRDPNLDAEHPNRTEHDVQLRFSYTLF